MTTADLANLRAPAEGAASGRFAAGCMVLSPLLLAGGAALLVGLYGGTAGEQLAAYADHEVRAGVAVNFAIAGTVLAIFAVAGVASAVRASQPRLGRVGGALTIIGLFGPAFFLGINHLGIQLAGLADRSGAVDAFEQAHATPNVIQLAGPALLLGLVVLAVGASRSGILPRWRSIALGLSALAPVGLISGVVVVSVVAWLAMAVALVPLGVRLLRSPAGHSRMST